MDNRYILDIIEKNLAEVQGIVAQTKKHRQIPAIYIELMLLKLKGLFIEISLLNKSAEHIEQIDKSAHFKDLENKFNNLLKNNSSEDSIKQIGLQSYQELTKLRTRKKKKNIYKIRESISLNDKIWFIKELFDGSIDLYNQTLNYIEKMDKQQQVVEYLSRFFNWDLNDQTTRDFFIIISKKFEE